jgi:hypothetical protein
MSIGVDVYLGLFTKAEWQTGKGRKPGSVVKVQKDGQSKEFFAVRLASGNWKNGCLVQLNSAGVVGTATTVSLGPGVAAIGQSVGVLVFGTSSAIQTMAGTAFGYAQIFGECNAQVMSATVPGMALGIGQASAGVLGEQVVESTASVMIAGINLGTTSASAQGFVPVFLNYPRFIPGPKDD